MSESNSENSADSAAVLYTISRKSTSVNESSKLENEENAAAGPSTVSAEIDSNSVETPDIPDTILCVLWNNGRIGAAYFNIITQQLYILSDMMDPKPQYVITRNLLRQINFKQILTMGTPCDPFVKFIIDLVVKTDETTFDSDEIRQVPPNFSLLQFKEYSYTVCRYKLLSLNLPNMPVDCSEAERDIFLHSLLNFDNKLCIHALGALIKFTEINWAHLNNNEKAPRLKFMHINQASMENHVYMDTNTFQALQIFQKRSHDAKFKHGGRGDSKEGVSVYKLFSGYCKSTLGLKCLRRILLNPINDINELKKRHNFIEFATHISNFGFVQALQSTIQKMFELEEILAKFRHFKGTTADWEHLYKTIYNILFLYEQSAPYRSSVYLLGDLESVITANLYGLETCIRDTIDFSCKLRSHRPGIKFGVDEELDAKKLKRQDIGKHLTAAAQLTINQLPDVLTECTIVYIPEMGYLLVTKGTEPNQLEHLGFQFMFKIQDTYHYKNTVCKELDKHLGCIEEDIISHEIRITQRVSNLITKYNEDIRKPLKILALMDCLFAMAAVAKEKYFVRPDLNTDNIIDIKEGRHILLEAQSDRTVPNDFKSGGVNSKVKVLTGPNSCGKSVYLKQVALLVYLAHIGSYIPAESANICMVYSIHSSIQVNESAALRLSAFMIDLSQMAQILYNARQTSFVIIDEFGKGTPGPDAMALLAAALKKYILNENICPHIVVSTHLQQIEKYLPQTSLLSYHTFDYIRDSENIIFLFKLINGISGSFAFDVAQAAGLDINIVNRAREIMKAVKEGTPLRSLNPNNQVYNAEYFLNVEIPPLDE